MAGRRPKPTALKALQGNPGHRPLNKREPKPTGTPTCPRFLDEEAKREWKRISTELTTLGLLTSVDRAALAAYCAAYSSWADAEVKLQKFGKIIKTPSGYPIPNPYVSIRNTSLNIMRQYLVEFGMTPASRSRLQVEPAVPVKDAFELLMHGVPNIPDEPNAYDIN
jgi:P27 family predicted phage terminase small subunit